MSLNRINRIVPLLLIPAVGACAAPPENCAFVYDASIKNEIVVPTLKRHGQRNYWLYRLDEPAVMNENGTVTLIFSQNSNVNDAGAFVIVLNACTGRVKKAYETEPTYILSPSGNR
jgi:hypothetical protein